MIFKKGLLLALLLSFILVFSADGSVGTLKRIKRNDQSKPVSNTTKSAADELINANDSKNSAKSGKDGAGNSSDKSPSPGSVKMFTREGEEQQKYCQKPESQQQRTGKSAFTEKGPFDEKFDEVQKVWQNLEAHNRHRSDGVSSFFRLEGAGTGVGAVGGFVPFHAQIGPSDSFLQDQFRSSRFHHSFPLTVSHFIPKRHIHSKKKIGPKKRKSVLILHSPLHARFTPNKNLSQRIIRDLDEPEPESLVDGSLMRGHEIEALHDKPLHYFEYPQFGWDNPKLSIEEHYGAAKIKPVEGGDTLFKLADMMMNRFKTDSKIFPGLGPYQTQITKISATPDMVISATTNTKHDMDKFSELAAYDHIKADVEPAAFGTLQFNPPLQLGGRMGEPKKILNLIENAIDTMVVDHDKDSPEEEIEVHCPVHHKNSEPSNDLSEMSGGEHAKNDVFEVCQCHFIKKKKESEK